MKVSLNSDNPIYLVKDKIYFCVKHEKNVKTNLVKIIGKFWELWILKSNQITVLLTIIDPVIYLVRLFYKKSNVSIDILKNLKILREKKIMEVKKLGIDQLKFSKGSKIYSKGEKAHFAYYVHSGKVNIYSPGGLLLGQIGEGEIFGERGPSLDESRSVTAEASTNCILYPINEKTIKKKIRDADPVVRAIMRSLLIRLNDINMKSEDFWRSLNVMTSLSDEKD